MGGGRRRRRLLLAAPRSRLIAACMQGAGAANVLLLCWLLVYNVGNLLNGAVADSPVRGGGGGGGAAAIARRVVCVCVLLWCGVAWSARYKCGAASLTRTARSLDVWLFVQRAGLRA